MALPKPLPGLVVRYSYLWEDEARRGLEEGRKDRPVVIVLAVEEVAGQPVVTVAPITHSPPSDPAIALEIPADTKRRLGLDAARSWVIVNEVNQFVWPGPDLRPTPGGAFAYGFLPPSHFGALRIRLVALAHAGRLRRTQRTE
jgi:hypothetical protein